MPGKNRAAYCALYESGELKSRADKAEDRLRSCTLCPRRCGIDRTRGETGFCRTGMNAVVSGYGPHFGEEPPLVGLHGSGTIFISNCNLACGFCQNFHISQYGAGREISCEEFAGMMINLQNRGCHNINIVSPSHVVPQLIRAVLIAAGLGLTIPVVYNSGGYDAVETLRLLDGIVDIYMPDAKYGDDTVAGQLSCAPHYVASMQDALKEMHRQVGDLVIEDGIAVRGMIIRHLVLPENLAGSDTVLPWIARELSPDSYVNIMDQYHPAWHAAEPDSGLPPALRRPVTEKEFRFAVDCARKSGLHRGF